jgi:hypothetical protein
LQLWQQCMDVLEQWNVHIWSAYRLPPESHCILRILGDLPQNPLKCLSICHQGWAKTGAVPKDDH